ncbi:hypothetical protein SPSIL_008930 [Sporomusa silvacetica DSM 10669]|uniref:Phage DNA packaging protein Nu1 n=1 Tax=Sporomusa silvacetica DSM 10669 TaxID=1123289 RepID=A0ABZ3IH86_9FIRM|nr:hypothetical protein [Sporomusa silvacetica]OZC13147.1 hypothetical protein SPSIL_56030 [Sporomusa silvacetica DSM 10669]
MEQIVKITKTTKTTADGLAACFGLSRPRIVQLANAGVLVRDENSKYSVTENIQRYINSKAGTDGELSLDGERTKHEKFKSRLTELKLAKMENRMHDAHNIELVMTEMLTNLRTQLLGLPSQLAGQLANQSQEKICEIMTSAVEAKLSELAGYEPAMFDEADSDEEDD